MRRMKVSESIGYINDKYVNEATLYTGKEWAGRQSRLLKWGIAACLAATLIVGVFVMPSQEGSNSGQVTVGGLLRPYRDISASANEIAIEWQWEYKTLYEQYMTIDLNGKEYISRMREVSASFLGDGLGSGDAVGYDLYTEQTYHRTLETNRIQGISDDLMVAVNMDGKYYVFMSSEYDPPATFGELLDSYDLARILDFGRFTVVHEGYVEEGYYSLENDDAIWQILAACRDARFVDGAAGNLGARNYISFTATSEPLGIYKRVFYVSEDGYIRTNIFDWDYLYQIGEEAAGQIIAYATENADEVEFEPYSYWLAGTLTEIGEGYILVDDSILCGDPGEGMVFKVLTDDLRISRYVDSKIVGIGDVVMVQFTGDIDIEAGNVVIGAYSMSPASISDGDVTVDE